jgi:hypothetical protein
MDVNEHERLLKHTPYQAYKNMVDTKERILRTIHQKGKFNIPKLSGYSWT